MQNKKKLSANYKVNLGGLYMNTLFAKMMLVAKQFEWVYQIKDAISMVLWPILIVVAAAGSIYAIVLGVNMARADSTEKREEAKKRVINVLVGMVIIVGLILLLQLFMGPVLEALLPDIAEPTA